MENLLTLLIILIFIFRGLSRLMETARREKEEEPHPEEWKEYFESMGIPPAEKEKETPPPPSPPPQAEKTTVEPVPLKTKIKRREFTPQLPPSKLPSLSFSLDKIREGIILAEILGPPRAKKRSK